MCVNEISLWIVPWAAAAREREIVGVYVNNRADWLSVSVIYKRRLQARWLFNFKVIGSWCVYWYQDFICVCVWQRKVDEASLGPRDLISRYHPIITFSKSFLLPLLPATFSTSNNTLDTSRAFDSPWKTRKKKKCCPGVWDFTGKKMEDTSDKAKQNPDHYYYYYFFKRKKIE